MNRPGLKEMAYDPANPYKIKLTGTVNVGSVPIEHFDVINPDGSRHGIYTKDDAEWWAARLYWEYQQDHS